MTVRLEEGGVHLPLHREVPRCAGDKRGTLYVETEAVSRARGPDRNRLAMVVLAAQAGAAHTPTPPRSRTRSSLHGRTRRPSERRRGRQRAWIASRRRANKQVSVRCEGDTDWASLVARSGGNPNSELGYVAANLQRRDRPASPASPRRSSPWNGVLPLRAFAGRGHEAGECLLAGADNRRPARGRTGEGPRRRSWSPASAGSRSPRSPGGTAAEVLHERASARRCHAVRRPGSARRYRECLWRSYESYAGSRWPPARWRGDRASVLGELSAATSQRADPGRSSGRGQGRLLRHGGGAVRLVERLERRPRRRSRRSRGFLDSGVPRYGCLASFSTGGPNAVPEAHRLRSCPARAAGQWS